MPSCPANLRGLETTNDVVCGKGSARGVTADEFPLGDILDVNMTIDFCLLLYEFIETYVLEQFLEISVVVGDVGSERRLVVVLLKNPIGGIAVNAHPLYIYLGVCSCLLLKDSEDVAVKASLVDANHIGESLTEIAREYEHVSYLLQMSEILRSALDGRKVEVIDAAYIVWSESHLLPTVRWNLHEVKGRRNPCSIPCSPIQGGAQLRADLLDGRQRKTSVDEERDEVIPEDIGHLMRQESAVEVRLQESEMMDERTETLCIGRVHPRFHLDELGDNLKQSSIGKVKSKE